MSRNAWEGFLPPRALVMVRKGSGVVEQSVAEDPAVQHLDTKSPAVAPAAIDPTAKLSDDSIQSRTAALQQITQELDGCTRCKLSQLGRTTIVVGEGNPMAELLFVGEGPGEQEDQEGRPFVGKAGQLLDRMIQAIGLSRDKVFIANVVKCRPPGNRNPEPDEIATCSPFLARQIAIIRPKIIVALGKFAAQTLMQSEVKITQIRGKFVPFSLPSGDHVKLMPTYHPAYLLRNPESKRDAWEDLQLVAKELGIELPAKKRGEA